MARTIAGQRILITESASGIERTVGELFSQEGVRIAIVDVNGERAATIARELEVVSLTADVSPDRELEATVKGGTTGKDVALKRVMSIEEIAQAIHFSTSEQSSFVTGSMLMADGGGRHAMM